MRSSGKKIWKAEEQIIPENFFKQQLRANFIVLKTPV